MYNLIHPRLCEPPHRITHWDKFEYLKQELRKGWKKGKPTLIGYPYNGKIQLISGSHRWHAAMELDMPIPVQLVTRSYIEEIWGTDDWLEFIQNPPLLE